MISNVFRWLILFFAFPFRLGVVEGGNGGGGGSDGNAGGAVGGSGGAGAGAGGAAAGALPSADFRAFLNPDGTIANPEGFFGKDASHLSKRFTSPHALAKSYVSLERQLSNGNKVAIPGENSTPEEWDAFFAKIGRPEKPDGYELKAPDGLPEGVWSEDEVKEFSTMAHKLGLSKKAANALVSWQAERIGKAVQGQQQALEATKAEAVAALQKEWGGNYQANLELAKKAAITFGGEEMLQHPLANDPAFIKAMAKAGAAISEGKLAGGRQSGGAPMSVEDFKGEIGRIRGDKEHPYNLPKHPNHAAAVEQMRQLYEKAYPS